MEEVTTQVAPLFIHKNIAGRFCNGGLIGKKRTHCFNNSNQHLQIELNGDGWNPKDWEWDSGRFVAKARPPQPGMLGLSTPNTGTVDNNASRSSNLRDEADENGNGLRLELGGASMRSSKNNGGNVQSSNSAEEPATSRPNKKVRSGSPGSGGTYPVCQVDNCNEDLSKSKDYHRRHKVCEIHSKVTQVIVGKQMQRFCQQCSRFHPLSEFDEGKRSCRRRLAGHNRRRRKTQPEDATSPVMHPINSNSAGSGNLDIVNLLTVLARGQGIVEKNVSNSQSVPDKNQLIEILSKLNSLPRPTEAPRNPAIPSSTSPNTSEQATLGQNNMDVNPALVSFPQRTSPGICRDQNKSSLGYKDSIPDVNNKPRTDLRSLWRREPSSSSHQSPAENSEPLQDTQIHLPLQLFSPPLGDDSPPNMGSSHKYFSSDSCSPPEVRSHSPSVPITRTLFPLETTPEFNKPDRMSICEEENINVDANPTRTFASGVTLELFNMGNKAGYTSSSGSDHSPPSFNSDPQKDRTGRIMFKLFDKDPSHFPGELRTQIYNWLSNSPSDMESFIRPGCVVLSIYVSMSSAAWEKLEADFAQQVSSLVQASNLEFWRNGRFSVNIGRQLAFHKDGKFNYCKPWSTPNSPELVAISPLAVVSGQCTSLVIKGRNLTSPGTKIHCAYMGGYSSKEVLGSTYQGINYDEIIVSDFKVHAVTSALGRCFIEVENGVRGNCFPVIIADAKVCQELRLLEREFDEEEKLYGVISDNQTQNISSPGSNDDILCFLNELGWLFQRQISSDIANHVFKPHRFQYLLTFSIERDYCALVKTLLDIFLERDSGNEGLSTECIESLDKMHLLHRAVKNRSKKMVDMLIHYSVPYDNGASNQHVFPPNLRGPGGITPLHLAACMSGSYDIVDILTDDPMEIGLHSWKSLLDDNGQSPSAYAIMRNDDTLNSLVAQKLVDRRNLQVSVSIGNEIIESAVNAEVRQRSSLQLNKKPDSCSKCAKMTYNRTPGSYGMLHRPFIHSMLAIAAVCVCVCLFFKSMAVPLTWENLDFGSM
ncbi:squamosa promoter-binding-like protein 14 isoform X1 [Silene latifolia]|uniref:squamosa promoter-binding-like protein 14 isoform X1 n=1 Tax=Silene latifolia TaxID=37657 RepID=UPI003D77D1FA